MTAEVLLYAAIASVLGAAFGSFLGVVAARVPSLIHAVPDGSPSWTATLSAVSWPASHCSSCKTQLSWHENLPVLTGMMLRGKCRHCGERFGFDSLVLEVGCMVAAAACVIFYGWSLQAALSFVLLAILLALIAIDLKEMLLADLLVWPLLPLGLLFQSVYGQGVTAGLLGATAGFAVMWLIGASYRLARGHDGLGGGDVKLAAALGAWLGIAQMPFFLMAAFTSATIIMLIVLKARGAQSDRPLPFGPFLATSAAVCLLFPQMAPTVTAGLFL